MYSLQNTLDFAKFSVYVLKLTSMRCAAVALTSSKNDDSTSMSLVLSLMTQLKNMLSLKV